MGPAAFDTHYDPRWFLPCLASRQVDRSCRWLRDISLIPDVKRPKGEDWKRERGETRWSCQLHSITSVFPAERCQEMSRIALIQWHTACTAFCTLHPSCSWYKWTWGSRTLTCIHCSSPALPRISGKTSPPPLQCPGKHQVSPGTATRSWRRIRPSKKKWMVRR